MSETKNAPTSATKAEESNISLQNIDAHSKDSAMNQKEKDLKKTNILNRKSGKELSSSNGNPILKFLKDLKMLAVLKYAYNLLKDLIGGRPALLQKKNAKDNAKRLLALVWPEKWYHKGDNCDARSRNYMLIMTVVGITNLFLVERGSILLKKITSALYQRRTNRVKNLLTQSLFICTISAAFSVGLSWSTSRLEILWRSLITRKLHKLYFNKMAYYHISKLKAIDRRTKKKKIKFPHPDQQLVGEVHQATKRVVNMIVTLTQSLPLLIWFTIKLLRNHGFSFAVLPHLYLFGAYEIVQRYLPKNFFVLNLKLTKASNDYKNAVGRLVSNAEAVAAVGGARVEKDVLQSKFNKFSSAQRALLVTKSQFSLLIKLAYHYNFRPFMMAFILTPMAFARSSNAMSGSELLAQQVSSVQTIFSQMIQALASLGDFLNLHAVHMQHNRSTYARVINLHDELVKLNEKSASADQQIYKFKDDCVAFDNVLVTTPTENLLVENLSFQLQQGSSLLITGHNGAGKSSIFRCLGGLWKVTKGTITKPPNEIFYIPQKPYQFLGTLRENICYPKLDSLDTLTNERMLELLEQVGLSHLISQESDHSLKNSGAGNDAHINWSDRLGLGEQQRLAMARLFHHRPEFAILDECTSAVNREMETFLYQECQRLGITYITICHRPALKKWHQHNLHLVGNGTHKFKFVTLGDGLGGESARSKSSELTASDQSISQVTQVPTLLVTKTKMYKKLIADQRSLDTTKLQSATSVQNIIRLLKIMLPGSYTDVTKLLMIIVGQTLLREIYGRIVGEMFAAVTSKRVGTFVALAALNFVVDIVTAFVEEGGNYLRNTIGIKWKITLSSHLRRLFLSNDAFYKIKYLDGDIKDPETRISADIENVTSKFADIWGDAILPSINCLWFGWSLSHYITGSSIAVLAAYATAKYAIVHYGKPSATVYEKRDQELDSKFRFVHSRLRKHAESIAFSGGGSREKTIADRSLGNLIDHQRKSENAHIPYNWAYRSITKDASSTSTKYAPLSTPIILNTFLQSLNTGTILGSKEGPTKDFAAAARQGFYVKQAIEKVLEAFSSLMGVFNQLTSLVGASERVCELLIRLEPSTSSLKQKPHKIDLQKTDVKTKACTTEDSHTDKQQQLSLHHVDLVTPTGQCLAADLDVALVPNKSILVTGRNSIGKTSFFRVLANLWPRYDSSMGKVMEVEGDRNGASSDSVVDLLLVPQKCYSVLGTFADQVTYPIIIPQSERDEAVEARIWEALDTVGLHSVCAIRGGLDSVDTWEDNLSLGEQQRLGVARLLFHRPRFGVLDECTDAVSMDIEEKMYESLRKAGVTCITISKRLTLEGFHTAELALGVKNDKGWQLNKLSHASKTSDIFSK